MTIRTIAPASLAIPVFLLLSTPAHAAAPAIPSLTSPSNNGVWEISAPLQWNLVSNATRYEVQVVDEDHLGERNMWSNAKDFSLTSNRFGASPEAKEMWPDQRIAWRARACNAQNECSAWAQSRYARVRPVHAAPYAPPHGTTTTERRPTFSWKFNTRRSTNHWFNVYVNGQKLNPDAPMINQNSGTTYSYPAPSNLSAGIKTWYVQACRMMGGQATCSTFGRSFSLTIQ